MIELFRIPPNKHGDNMKARIFVLFLFVFLSLSEAQAQIIPPLDLTLKNTRSYLVINSGGPRQFSELAMSENSESFPPLRKVAISSVAAELPIKNFFESTASKCAGRFSFGMFPLPGMCYQSLDKKVQFLALTTGVKTEVLLRYNFWSS